MEGKRSGSNNSRCNFRLEKSWRIYACTYITVVEGMANNWDELLLDVQLEA